MTSTQYWCKRDTLSPNGMCSRSSDLFNSAKITDNISETVRDISYKNSSGNETANVNFYAVHPEAGAPETSRGKGALGRLTTEGHGWEFVLWGLGGGQNAKHSVKE